MINKNILVLGATGLIGSTMYRVLKKEINLNVYGTSRSKINSNDAFMIYNFDANNIDNLEQIIIKKNINCIVNCIGLTKHRDGEISQLESCYLNSLLPNKLALFSQKFSLRLIHISTVCVFSGKDCSYTENSICDPVDWYGKTKFLGEISNFGVLTIRTSTIGHELLTSYGLLNWFLKQRSCKGFKNAYFSGTTTLELANIINNVINNFTNLTGLYHIGGYKISKYDLLNKINLIYNLKINIDSDVTHFIDRSFSSEKFCNATGYKIKNWDEIIYEMKDEFLVAKL